jgi:hypothetical protein
MTLLSFRALRMTAGETLLSIELSGEPGAISDLARCLAGH